MTDDHHKAQPTWSTVSAGVYRIITRLIFLKSIEIWCV
jgi:hypothetical protein